jgi:putative aldouronate transport system substrate-binding protein
MKKELDFNKKYMFLSLVFIVFVVIGSVFFFANKKEEQAEKSKGIEEQEQDTSYFITNEPITYTIFMPVNKADLDFENNAVWQQLQEMTNIYFEFISPVVGEESEEAFNQLIASGNYPDAVLNTTAGYPGGFSKAIDDNVYIDISPYIKDYAPNYYQFINKYPIIQQEVYTQDNEMPGFYKIYDPEKSLPIIGGLSIRKDFFEQMNMELPETIDEWTLLLRELKKIDGIEEPLIFGQENGVNVTAEFLSAYGIGAAPISLMNPVSQLFYPKDGEMHYGAIEPGYKEYLLLMNAWYTEGLLDQDFGVRDFTNFQERRQLIGEGTAAAHWQYAEWFTETGSQEHQKITFQAAPMPKLNKDDKNVMWMVSRKPYIGELMSITTACKDIIPLIQFFDFLYSEEGIILTNYGIEGDTYNYIDNTYVFTNKILEYESGAFDGYGKYVNNHNGALFDLSYTIDIQEQLYTNELMEMRKIWLNSVELFVNNYDLTVEENTELIKIMTSISEYVKEYTIQAIVNRNTALKWEEHIEVIKEMEIQRALNIMQTAYDRQERSMYETTNIE